MSALLSGITVGFAVAMPVGPIGVLCIKRSLKDGFRYGLATGCSWPSGLGFQACWHGRKPCNWRAAY